MKKEKCKNLETFIIKICMPFEAWPKNQVKLDAMRVSLQKESTIILNSSWKIHHNVTEYVLTK